MSIPAFSDKLVPKPRQPKLIPPPVKTSIETFDRITEAATLFYQRLNGSRLPSIQELATYTGLSEKKIVSVITSHQFLVRMSQRGITWSSKKRILEELTPEQVAAITVITDPTLKLDLRARLKRAGIPYSVYRNWLRNPAFSQIVKSTAEMTLEDHLPDFHTKIVERGLSGDLNAIKFAYELTGRHDPAKQQMVDLNRMVMLLLEVITKYIRDPQVLTQINNDVDLILKGKTPAAIDMLPANYVLPGELKESEVELPPIGFFEWETDEH